MLGILLNLIDEMNEVEFLSGVVDIIYNNYDKLSKKYKKEYKEIYNIIKYLEEHNYKNYNHFKLFYMFCDLSDNNKEFTIRIMVLFCVKYNLNFDLYKDTIENK